MVHFAGSRKVRYANEVIHSANCHLSYMMSSKPLLEKVRPSVSLPNPLLREVLAEFGSTFLLVFIGLCNVAQFVLTKASVNTWIQVNVGWGFAIAFCVYAAVKISGAHMNPAISLMFFSFGKLSAKKLILYSLAQTAGAFIGAAATYAYYLPLFDHFDGGVRNVSASAGVFASYPAPHMGLAASYVDQMIGTGILAFFICLLVDERNDIPNFLVPLLIGFVVMMIGTSFGVNLGYPINPARDFGPRLFSYFVYGSEVFTHPYAHYWVAPVIGPLVGGPLGGWLYQVLFGFHLPASTKEIYRIVDATELKH